MFFLKGKFIKYWLSLYIESLSETKISTKLTSRKGEALKRNHKVFGRRFIFKSIITRIELAKEKTTRKIHKIKVL